MRGYWAENDIAARAELGMYKSADEERQRGPTARGTSSFFCRRFAKRGCGILAGPSGLRANRYQQYVRNGRLMPTFAFIDPFGWKGNPFALIKKILANPSCEAFVNFMYEEINRFLSHRDQVENFTTLFGCEDWKDCVALTEPDLRNRCLHDLYVRQLHKEAGAKHVRSFEMSNDLDITDYYLFYATNHKLGLQKMKEAMWKIDESGEFHFSDRTDPNQFVLFEKVANTAVLRAQMLGKFSGKVVAVAEIEEFVVVETAFRETHYKRQVLKVLEEEGKTKAVDSVPEGQLPSLKCGVRSDHRHLGKLKCRSRCCPWYSTVIQTSSLSAQIVPNFPSFRAALVSSDRGHHRSIHLAGNSQNASIPAVPRALPEHVVSIASHVPGIEQQPAGRMREPIARFLVLLCFAALLMLGVAIYRDYGISFDESGQRVTGAVTVKHVIERFAPSLVPLAMNDLVPLDEYKDNDYGVAFEAPAVVLEMLFGRTDTRDIFLFRHLVTFLVCLGGAYAVYSLALRRFADRRIALLAVAFLVLTPRLFAESFYNSKDAVFLAAP